MPRRLCCVSLGGMSGCAISIPRTTVVATRKGRGRSRLKASSCGSTAGSPSMPVAPCYAVEMASRKGYRARALVSPKQNMWFKNEHWVYGLLEILVKHTSHNALGHFWHHHCPRRKHCASIQDTVIAMMG